MKSATGGKEGREAGRPLRAPEFARRFDAVESRHCDVEHNDIGMEPLRLSEEFSSIATLPTTKHSPASTSGVRASIAPQG